MWTTQVTEMYQYLIKRHFAREVEAMVDQGKSIDDIYEFYTGSRRAPRLIHPSVWGYVTKTVTDYKARKAA